MRLHCLVLMIIAFFNVSLFAQSVAINNIGNPPHSSAMLDVKSDTKGMLIPRLSSQARKSMVNPATGLLVYDSTEGTLFMYDGGRWLGFQPMPDNIRPTSKLLAPPDNQDTLFAGYSVAISDQFAVIGAPYRNQPQFMSGGVYVYRRTGEEWNYFTTLTPGAASDTALFGQSVNIAGNYIIVGAPLKKNASNQRVGAAYIFNFNGNSWLQSAILWGTAVGTEFAVQVDINNDGSYAAVSEPGATASGINGAGVVRVFNRLFSWYLQFSLQDPAPILGERFGDVMSMSPTGIHIAASAPSKTIQNTANAGYVAIFKRSGSSWSMLKSFEWAVQGLHQGAMLDISDQKFVMASTGTKTVNEFNIGAPWSSFPYQFNHYIDGVATDAGTDQFYTLSGPVIYRSGDYVAKNISTMMYGYGLSQIFDVHNDWFIIGSPGEESNSGVYAGGFYIGKVNKYQ